MALAHPEVRQLLDGADPERLRVSTPEIIGHAEEAHSPFIATVFDPAANRAFARSWRVVDKASKRGYSITPGLADGTADAFGVSDLWFLHYNGAELDDGVSVVGGSPADTQVRLDQYVDGESIDGADVVVWYAGHFVHDQQHPEPHQGHIVGPELRPINW